MNDQLLPVMNSDREKRHIWSASNFQASTGGILVVSFVKLLRIVCEYFEDFLSPKTLNSSGFNCRSMQNSSIPSESIKSSLSSLYFSNRATILASE